MNNYDDDENIGKFDIEQNQDTGHDETGPDKDDSAEPVVNAGTPNDPDKLLDGGAAKVLTEEMEQSDGDQVDGLTSSREYEVGYRKPPKDTQFKKGHSGNKKGRPRGRRNFKTDLEINLASKVKAKKNGKEVNISRQELIIDAQTTRAAKGDPKSASLIFGLIAKYLSDNSNENSDTDISIEEAEILEVFAARFNRSDPEVEVEADSSTEGDAEIDAKNPPAEQQLGDQTSENHHAEETSTEASTDARTPSEPATEDGEPFFSRMKKEPSQSEPGDTPVNEDAASANEDTPWWAKS